MSTSPKTDKASKPCRSFLSKLHIGKKHSQPKAPSTPTTSTAPRTINSYAALDKTGECKPWQFEARPLGAEDVEIKISHCGVCGSDTHAIDSDWFPTPYPCVAGHEIIGHVTQAGHGVKGLAVGDRVGVGPNVWACLNRDPAAPCRYCARGQDVLCDQIVFTFGGKYKDGSTTRGGFSDYIRVDSNFAVKIPENIPSDTAAPLLCAGVTVFTPLKQEGVKAGDRVGVIGIGGLGHIAIQFINALGATPVAFSRSANKEKEAREIGAKEFYDLSNEDHRNKAMGSVDYLVLTADGKNMPFDLYLSLLRKCGTFIICGMPTDQIKIQPFLLLPRAISVRGSITGSIQDTKDMLELASKGNVRAIIQKLPMSKINEGLDMVRNGTVRYRVVLEN
jgi:alcohol dehydrogenase (NADP+)